MTLAFVFMSFNIIVGRAVAGDVPPVGLSFWRWTVASLLFLPFSIAAVRAQWRLMRDHWKILVLIAVVMVLLGNTLVYVGLQSTTALNGGLIPASRPAIILVLAWLIVRGTVKGHQWLGIAVALLGVLLVLTRGDPAVLGGLDFNRGDLWLVVSSVGIASYQVLIARAPRELDQKALLQSLITLGAVMLAPVYLWETLSGRPVTLDWPTAGAVAYVAVFPSIIAIYLINAGILALGPARASVYNYLQPLFVAIIAVPLLGEEVRWYHPVAFGLVVIGILISSRTRGGR
jgi:drug/metabolite transporter (DMT)-like permease